MIFKGGIFGRVVAHVHVIEFQKKGLPHMHLLITLNKEDKLQYPQDINKFI